MKKLDIILGVIIIILLIWIVYPKNHTKIKIFELLDADSITEIYIFNIGTDLHINGKSNILDSMNDLKSLTFSRQPDLVTPNKDPDAWMFLKDKNGKVNSLIIYGDVAIYNNEKDYYEIDSSTYATFNKLCKKYK